MPSRSRFLPFYWWRYGYNNVEILQGHLYFKFSVVYDDVTEYEDRQWNGKE